MVIAESIHRVDALEEEGVLAGVVEHRRADHETIEDSVIVMRVSQTAFFAAHGLQADHEGFQLAAPDTIHARLGLEHRERNAGVAWMLLLIQIGDLIHLLLELVVGLVFFQATAQETRRETRKAARTRGRAGTRQGVTDGVQRMAGREWILHIGVWFACRVC